MVNREQAGKFLDEIRPGLHYYNEIGTPLGKIMNVTVIKNGSGTDRGKLRLYGNYALVYLIEGNWEYVDATGLRKKIGAGDLILVTPSLPHRYCTAPGRYWTEWHIVFSGPVFDLCNDSGILSGSPVQHLEPVDTWLSRLSGIVADPSSHSEAEKLQEIHRLLGVIFDIWGSAADGERTAAGDGWLALARRKLDENLETEVDYADLAMSLGVSYETFRKRFQKSIGVSPHVYRTERRIHAAANLLTLTTMTNHQIATHLGFVDEFHFSKRFKQIMGVGPQEYRRSATHFREL